ncbi:MAG: pyruvate kinase [archaeon]|nr:pyruvate kinase [archaeon]
MAKEIRRTKIVCTLGPGCDDEEKLKGIIKAGLNCARFNFSHGSHEESLVRVERFQKCCKELGVHIPMLLDTKGPEIRTGKFPEKITLKTGQKFTFTVNECEGNDKQCSVSHKDFAKDLNPGNTVLVDDGLIAMRVETCSDDEVLCTVLNGGQISSNKGINLPDVKVSIPNLSPKDISDLEFGCKNGFDYVAGSFIQCKEDVEDIRKYLTQFGRPEIQIISKIENQEGIKNFDSILEASDGIMVARGDLGVEVPTEKMPMYQKEMISKTVKANKICITATQMLDSMIHNPRPTRAEVTDVANAIIDGTTCVMLSGETASGAYPVEAVTMMDKIAREIEQKKSIPKIMSTPPEEMEKLNFNVKDERRLLLNYNLAKNANAMRAKILCLSESALSARILSNFRPAVPILVATTKPEVARKLSITWGTYTIVIDEPDFKKRMDKAVEEYKKLGLLVDGDACLVSGGSMKIDHKGFTEFGGIYVV